MLIWNMPAIVRGHCFQPLSFREQLSIFSIPFSSLTIDTFPTPVLFCTSFCDFRSRRFRLRSASSFPAGFIFLLYVGWIWPLQLESEVHLFCVTRCPFNQRVIIEFIRFLFSSNARTTAITGSQFLYKFTAALIYVTFHSSSIDLEFRPLLPFSLGKKRMLLVIHLPPGLVMGCAPSQSWLAVIAYILLLYTISLGNLYHKILRPPLARYNWTPSYYMVVARKQSLRVFIFTFLNLEGDKSISLQSCEAF